jgi:hypothetical protein
VTDPQVYRPPAGTLALPCGCAAAGVREVDVARHKAYHQLAEEQGGPVSVDGPRAHTLSRTVYDDKVEASGKRSPGWRRQAHHASE